MSDAKITEITVEGTGKGARMTVVVQGLRPVFAETSLLMEGRQATLLLGPLDETRRPKAKLGQQDLVVHVGLIASRFGSCEEHRDEFGVAVDALAKTTFTTAHLTQDNPASNITHYYVDIA